MGKYRRKIKISGEITLKILAIETSASACSVAIQNEDQQEFLHQIAPMQQSQLLLPMIDELLKKTNLKLNNLDALAFGCGPGSFTGIRIAASVVQGLGFGANLPVIPISSLLALSQVAYETYQAEKILVALDARMSGVYWGHYIYKDKVMVLEEEEKLSYPSEVSSKNQYVGVGNAWSVYPETMPKIPILSTDLLPTAGAVLTLAREKFVNKEWVNAEDALPVYLRQEVVKVNVAKGD